MRITRWGELGILCSLFLAQQAQDSQANSGKSQPSQTQIGAADIAKSQGIPLQYTQQILHRLKKGGIVTSRRGPRGGYELARSPEHISLYDVVAASEGEVFQLICDEHPVYAQACSASVSCGLRGVWQGLQERISDYLKDQTLAEVMKHHMPTHGEEAALIQVRKKQQHS